MTNKKFNKLVEDNSNFEKKQNFWTKLINGDFGLLDTYWGYAVLKLVVIFLLVFLVSVLFSIDQSSPSFLIPFLMSLIAYETVVHIGVWRAAKKYSGNKIWAILAQGMVIIYGLFASWLFIKLMIKAMGAL